MNKLKLVIQVAAIFTVAFFNSIYSFSQEVSETKREFSFKERNKKGKPSSIPFLPIFSENGTVYGITDSIGHISLEEETSYFIKSYFFKDSSFVLNSKSKSTIYLEREEIALEEIEIKSFRNPEDHLKYLNKNITPALEKEAYLSNFSGYFAVKQREKYIDFIQATGLSLTSKSQKWKPYDFVQAGWAGGDSYQFFVPLELRRSHHWDWSIGDTIASGQTSQAMDRSDQYLIKPFYSRELLKAFEYSWPLSTTNLKYYEFRYSLENGKEIIVFSTKDGERTSPNSNLFLIGEGRIVLDETGEGVESISINFSKYNYIAFPKDRRGRERQMGGSLSAIFEKSNDKIFVREVQLESKLFGPVNIGNPRPYRKGSEVTIIEKVNFENFQFVKSKEDLESLEQGMEYIGFESMVPYNQEYWSSNTLLDPDLYNKIKKDLGSKIPLSVQFKVNSGKRLIPEEKGLAAYKDYVSKVIPQLNSISKGLSNK